MKAEDIKKIMDRMQINQGGLASAIGVSEKLVEAWRYGYRSIQPDHEMKILDLLGKAGEYDARRRYELIMEINCKLDVIIGDMKSYAIVDKVDIRDDEIRDRMIDHINSKRSNRKSGSKDIDNVI